MPDKATLEEYLVQVRRIPEHREAEAEKKIRKMFRELSEDLNAFLGNEYAKYAEDDKLTHAILHQKGEYARFLEEVLNRVDGIAPEVHEEIQGLIENVYKVSYTGMAEAVEATKTVEGLHKYFEPVKAITPETVKRAVKNPIPKLTLAKTLERNRKKIVAAIRREMTTGLTHGDRMSTMAGRIQKYVEGDYRKAILIARTEVHRVREAGFNDSANRIDDILKEHSDYRIVKTWKTMQDGAVRRLTKHNEADHTIMEGQTVLQDEQFTLSDGTKTDAPGQSGVAAQDCNCRCYASRDLMSDAEFYVATGRHFNSATESRKTDANTCENIADEDNQYFNYETVDKSGENDIIRLGINLFDKSDNIYYDAFSIEEEKGFEDIFLHGNSKMVQMRFNGELKNYNVSEFAEYLKNNPDYKGGDIRLAACSAGKGDDSFAQQLSKQLGIKVKAPDDDVYYIPDEGVMYVGSPYSNTGKWRVFNKGDEIK